MTSVPVETPEPRLPSSNGRQLSRRRFVAQQSVPLSTGAVTVEGISLIAPVVNLRNQKTPPESIRSGSKDRSAGALTAQGPSGLSILNVASQRTTFCEWPTLTHVVPTSSSLGAPYGPSTFGTILSSANDETKAPASRRFTSQSAQKAWRRLSSTKRLDEKLAIIESTPTSASNSRPLAQTGYETRLKPLGSDRGDHKIRPPNCFAEMMKAHNTQDASNRSHTDRGKLDTLYCDDSMKKAERDITQYDGHMMESLSRERFWMILSWLSDTPSLAEEEESRRAFGVSAISTVAAVVIDSPHWVQRSLRRTKKSFSLRPKGRLVAGCEPVSTACNSDLQLRLVPRSARVLKQNCPYISSDDFSAEKATSESCTLPDTIPAVTIPERRSLLNSAPESRTSSGPSSQQSGPLAPQVAASRNDHVGVGPQRPWTMSNSGSTVQSESPAIGPRARSPLPLSCSITASGSHYSPISLTSENLRRHNLGIGGEVPKHRNQQPVLPLCHNMTDPLGCRKSLCEPSHILASMIDVKDHMSTPRVPSLPSNTQRSSLSPAPEPEIREATAVSIFVHNNRSLLLIDHQNHPMNSHSNDRKNSSISEPRPETLYSPTQPTGAFSGLIEACPHATQALDIQPPLAGTDERGGRRRYQVRRRGIVRQWSSKCRADACSP